MVQQADWYEHPETAGLYRYWDGSAWTEDVLQLEPGMPPPRGAPPSRPGIADRVVAPAPPAPRAPPASKGFGRRTIVVGATSLLVGLVVGTGIGASESNAPESSDLAAVAAAEDSLEEARDEIDRLRVDDGRLDKLSESVASLEAALATAEEEATEATRTAAVLALPISDQDDADQAPGQVARDASAQQTEVLRVTDFDDGDSFDGSDGNTYRLGLVDTPETGEECSSDATAFTRTFLSGEFVANVYATDTYGRLVAEVFDDEGRSLNVALAESGLGTDRYLSTYRDENPDLADRLDAAFASAGVPDCAAEAQAIAPFAAPVPTPTPEPAPADPPAAEPAPAESAAPDCHPAYDPCLPNVGDLNCGDIGQRVRVKQPGNDPYGLDRDNDGFGCESS